MDSYRSSRAESSCLNLTAEGFGEPAVLFNPNITTVLTVWRGAQLVGLYGYQRNAREAAVSLQGDRIEHWHPDGCFYVELPALAPDR